MKNENMLNYALAGLIINIGKFSVRANVGESQTEGEKFHQNFQHDYRLAAENFAKEFIPAPWREDVLKLVAFPTAEGHDTRIVSLADSLSIGRQAGHGNNMPLPQLLSIFNSVKADGQDTPAKKYLPLSTLRIEKNVLFPSDELSSEVASQYYIDLWDGFTSSAGKLRDVHQNNGDLATYLESMLLLMQRYCWCIPSLADISLYDHSRMAAALAVVLATGNLTEEVLQKIHVNPEVSHEPVALLVGGDMSGVQDFIYTITARGATPALRGRSFYLQILTDVIARYVLQRLELPITNLIYAGGGNFYLLARLSDKDRLIDIQAEVSRILLHAHGGNLFLALGSQELRASDFFAGKLSSAWQLIHHSFRSSKQRRFVELEGDLHQLVFMPQGVGGGKDNQCSICGVEHPDTKVDPDTAHRGDERVYKCPLCNSFEALGDKLRHAILLIYEHVSPIAMRTNQTNQQASHWLNVLQAFGFEVAVERAMPTMASEQTRKTVLVLKESDLSELSPGVTTTIGQRLLVNVTPLLSKDKWLSLRGDSGFPGQEELGEYERLFQKQDDIVKPFSILEYEAQGIKRLGILRMDVDNLGKLFSEGLGEKATLAHIAGLSFTISLFFEGWVQQIAQEMNQQSKDNRIYSIYSGGDDLFFVGAWDAVVELAQRIRADLTIYAANHPGIHASAGIALVGGKYPLAQAAEDAGEAEKAAKALRWWNKVGEQRSKDAISFLGQALPWQVFGMEPGKKDFASASALMEFLCDALERKEDGSSPKALLRHLLDAHDQYQKQIEARKRTSGIEKNWEGKPQALWGPWMWRTYYNLTRMAKRYEKENDDNAAFQIRDQLQQENFRNMEWIGLAARWAELRTREK